MPTREQHYFLYDPSDVHPDLIVIEMLDYTEFYREEEIPLLYLCRDCGEAARMLEEAAIYREEANRIKKMERSSDYFFQVQRTRLVSLEPIDSARKWQTFRKIVDAYNLGETGDCCLLSDYIARKGQMLHKAVYGEGREEEAGKLQLPGNERHVAELINRYNKKVLSTKY